jgi:hypothetical protein
MPRASSSARSPGSGAVDLVAGHPGGRDTGVQRTGDHCLRQGRLGREPDLGGDAGGAAAGRIVDPALREVQVAVDHGVPSIGGIDEIDGDLGVLNAAGGAGVLALHAHRVGAFLAVPGLVDDQHRGGVGQVVEQVSRTSSRTLSWSQTAPLSRYCRPSGWPGRRARRSSSSSCGAGRPAAPARMRGRAVVAPPWQSGRRPGPAARPAPPATWQGLRCGPRPPCDLRLSTYHRIITGGRPRLPAGSTVPGAALTSQVTISGWSTREGPPLR